MIPGPSELHPEVLKALAQPLPPHYGAEWVVIYNETAELAKKVFKTVNEVIISPTPGSIGIEMGILNMVGPGEKLLCIVNGFFGRRVAEIARYNGIGTVELRAEPGEIVEPSRLEAALDEDSGISVVAMVHNESSTGVLNPIRDYLRISKKRGLLTLVDTVSSYGGIEIDVDGWGIDFCVGYPNKCLSSIPSAVPISISSEVWSRVEKGITKPRSFFMNLRVWRHFIDEWADVGHPYPTTINAYAVLALRAALNVALEEGLEKRYRRHITIGTAVRRAVAAIGLEMLPREEICSPVISAIRLPPSIAQRSKQLSGIMLKKHRIMIGGGLAELAGKIIRIGHMGVTASARYVLPTIAALESALTELGYPAEGGMEAFLQELRRSGV